MHSRSPAQVHFKLACYAPLVPIVRGVRLFARPTPLQDGSWEETPAVASLAPTTAPCARESEAEVAEGGAAAQRARGFGVTAPACPPQQPTADEHNDL